MRAAVKKAVKNNGGKQQHLKFQYDPFSYALNFDDGCCRFREEGVAAFERTNLKADTVERNASVTAIVNTTLVYVILVKA